MTTYRVTVQSFEFCGENIVIEVEAAGFTVERDTAIFWVDGEDGMKYRSAAYNDFLKVEEVGKTEGKEIKTEEVTEEVVEEDAS